MASTARSTLGHRRGVLVTAAAVVTILTAATAAAAPTPMGAPAGVRVPDAALALGTMGTNDPELGSRTARRPAAPPVRSSTARAATPRWTLWTVG
jgi:hypothetical protein